jgi:hypothetical protein
VEEHNARARSVCLEFVPRIIKEVAAGDSWIDWRVRVTAKNHAGFALSESSRRDSARRVV